MPIGMALLSFLAIGLTNLHALKSSRYEKVICRNSLFRKLLVRIGPTILKIWLSGIHEENIYQCKNVYLFL